MAEGIVKLAKDAVVIVWDENDYGSFEGCYHSPRGVDDVFPGGLYALSRSSISAK